MELQPGPVPDIPWREIFRWIVGLSILVAAIATLWKYVKRALFSGYRTLSRAANKRAFADLTDVRERMATAEKALTSLASKLEGTMERLESMETEHVRLKAVVVGLGGDEGLAKEILRLRDKLHEFAGTLAAIQLEKQVYRK